MLGVGFAGAQAGHLLAYQLRFGTAAQQIQAGGAHAYFPAVAKTGLGAVSLVLLVTLLIVGAARFASGHRLEPASAPPYVRLLAVVYTVQLACFGVQETMEALAGGGHPISAPLLILWGTAGQLPVALVATLGLRWLSPRFSPAVARLRVRADGAYRRVTVALAFYTAPLATDLAPAWDVAVGDPWRGPPSSS